MGICTSCILYIKQNPTTHTRDNGYDYEVIMIMTRRKYKITRCNILQKDFQSSQHDFQCNVTNTSSPHTQYEAGDFNIRAITSKCSSGSKASVYVSNDSFLPLHRSVCFMVARASVAQEGSPKNCRSLIIHQFIIGSAKNALGIAGPFSKSKSVEP